ncbi:MAG: alpha/beta fold hydrolase [Dongiaceae bacterium]
MILPKPRLLRAAFATAATLSMASPATVAAAGLADAIGPLDPHSCYIGELVCVTLPVPLDHDNPGDNRTLEIDFAIHLATGAHRGVLVYAVGGPGQAGVGISEWALWSFDSTVLEHYDIVLFDQRGTGPRHGVDCRIAAATYSMIPWDLTNPTVNVEQARAFVDECVAESGRADILPFLGTRQAARDLEIFRQAIGALPIWLYGASYGTYFAQTYAAIFPEAIAGLILDSVMDPGGDIVSEGHDSAAAAEALFRRMSLLCNLDPTCRAMFAPSVTGIYDRLMADLEREPIDVMFPLSGGGLAARTLTADMLAASLSYALYTPFDRTAFMHVLASAAQGEFVPLLRLAYQAFEFDPDTLMPLAVRDTNSGMYWGAFYAVSCPDFVARPGNPVQSASAVFEAGLDRRDSYPRFFHYLIGLNLECQFWPGLDDEVEAPVLAAGNFRTLILASDHDHATPYVQALRVYDRLENATMVTVGGGPHVVLGWGDPCVDDAVTDWLVSGIEPRPGKRSCKQSLFDEYYAVDVTRRHDPANATDIGWGIISAISSAELTTGWDGFDSMQIGCDHGGTLTLNPPASEAFVYRYELSRCRVWHDTELTGTVIYSATTRDWGWQMVVSLDGAHAGDLALVYDLHAGSERIEGVLDGLIFVADRAEPAERAVAPVKTAR